MDKLTRKNEIGFMCVTAAMAKLLSDRGGVCGVGVNSHAKPYVHLQPWRFMELFGEDTDYWYNEGDPDYRTINTEVNGIEIFALMTKFDIMENGELIA